MRSAPWQARDEPNPENSADEGQPQANANAPSGVVDVVGISHQHQERQHESERRHLQLTADQMVPLVPPGKEAYGRGGKDDDQLSIVARREPVLGEPRPVRPGQCRTEGGQAPGDVDTDDALADAHA